MNRTLRLVPTYLVLALAFLVVCFPVWYTILGSFMGPADINSYPATLWPTHGWRLGQLARALATIPLGRQYLNSWWWRG